MSPTGKRSLTVLRRAEAAEAELEETTAALGMAARAAVGVVGRYELGPMADALRASRLGWYPLGAITVLGAVDALFAGALVGTGFQISTTLGIPNLSLLVYVRVAALIVGGTVALRAAGAGSARVARAGAIVAAAGLLTTALARNPWQLAGATALACLGSGAAWAVQRPLLFAHYRPDVRVRALCVHGAGFVLGVAGAAALVPLADALGLTWRPVFLALGGLAVAGTLVASRLSDGPAGAWEDRVLSGLVQRRVGPVGETAAMPDPPLTLAQRFRQVISVPAAVPLLTAGSSFGLLIVALPPYLVRLWSDRWGLGADAGSGVLAGLCVGAALGLAWFARTGELAFRAAPARLLRTSGRLGVLGALMLPLAGAAPWLALSLGLWIVVFSALVVLLVTAAVVLLALVRPPARPHASLTLGVAVFGGALTGNFVLSGFASRFGLRWALAALALYVLTAARSAGRAARTVEADLDATVAAMVEEVELRTRASQGGHLPLLAVRGVDFSYGPVQVLFDVSLTVDEGDMVALLGTNGAGKSTLLRLISGICAPTRGSVRFRGADITYVGPDRRVRLGIGQVPGGRAVFGPMTVEENLRVFGYTLGRNRRAVEAGVEAALAAFPSLAAHAGQPAAALSGGQQQMLGLAKAFVLRPQVLLIDELSLGLAPIVVGELLDTVRRLNAEGTAVVVVEQSVNIALTLVQHAYFMEKGQIRFDGRAADLAARPDLLRSVFLEGAAAGMGPRARRRAPVVP